MNIITAVFCGANTTSASGLYQYDYGQILRFQGIDLPSTYEVHFCNEGEAETITVLGNADGVAIPDQFLLDGAAVRAWVFLHTGADDGETEYAVRMPVTERPEPSDIEPTPVQQDIITQAIAALNNAIDETSASAQQAAQDAQTASTAAENASEDAASALTYRNEAQASAVSANSAALAAASSANAASASEDAAHEYAEDAETSADRAEQAAASAGYMFISMDENGHLIYERTSNTDVDLSLVDGHLIMGVA